MASKKDSSGRASSAGRPLGLGQNGRVRKIECYIKVAFVHFCNSDWRHVRIPLGRISYLFHLFLVRFRSQSAMRDLTPRKQPAICKPRRCKRVLSRCFETYIIYKILQPRSSPSEERVRAGLRHRHPFLHDVRRARALS